MVVWEYTHFFFIRKGILKQFHWIYRVNCFWKLHRFEMKRKKKFILMSFFFLPYVSNLGKKQNFFWECFFFFLIYNENEVMPVRMNSGEIIFRVSRSCKCNVTFISGVLCANVPRTWDRKVDKIILIRETGQKLWIFRARNVTRFDLLYPRGWVSNFYLEERRWRHSYIYIYIYEKKKEVLRQVLNFWVNK